MGSKLPILATVGLIAFATVTNAAADGNKKALARQLFMLGIEEYKAKKFEAAAVSMGKAYEIDPVPDSLYALAQAERMANRCGDAIVHYQKLLEVSKDDTTAKAVAANIELCRQIEAGKTPVVDPKADAAEVERQDAPTLQIKTVYRTRTEQRSDKLGIGMLATGGVSLTGGLALFLVARSTRSDADRAVTLDEFNDKFDRAKQLRWMAYGAGGVGLVLVTYASIRLIRGGTSQTVETPEVAIVPVTGGSMVSWSSSW